MHPFDIRRRSRISLTTAGLAAAGLIIMVALTGCGSGQLSQTAAHAPAIDGTSATVNNVALRNVYIQATQSGDYLRPGQTVELMLVAANRSPDVADRLVSITTEIGTVTISGSGRLPAGGVLFVGTPGADNVKQVARVETAELARASVSLAKPISNGLTYDFTFTFDKAGSTTVRVPISTGSTPPKQQTPGPGEHS